MRLAATRASAFVGFGWGSALGALERGGRHVLEREAEQVTMGAEPVEDPGEVGLDGDPDGGASGDDAEQDAGAMGALGAAGEEHVEAELGDGRIKSSPQCSSMSSERPWAMANVTPPATIPSAPLMPSTNPPMNIPELPPRSAATVGLASRSAISTSARDCPRTVSSRVVVT